MPEMFFNSLMAKIYPDRHDGYDTKPLPIGKASMLTVLMFIILFVVGSLMIGGYFSMSKNSDAPIGNDDSRVKP